MYHCPDCSPDFACWVSGHGCRKYPATPVKASVTEDVDSACRIVNERHRIAELERENAKLREALEYYAGAPWVGHAGSWAHSNIAEKAHEALGGK